MTGLIVTIFLIATISSTAFAAADNKDNNKDSNKGYTIYDGKGSPSSSLGNDRDLYLDDSNGDFWQKDHDKWTHKINLVGPAGPAGPEIGRAHV